MKKRLQGLIAGILIGAMLTSGVVFAKQISETVELFYNNIKIYIDGGEIVPKDANGNVVEPFTMNGTTYLPVRAISNALGKDVEWDGETFSVYIGKSDKLKPDNRLDKIQYSNYELIDNKDDRVKFYRIDGHITDFNGNSYTNGLIFSGFNGGGHKITFPLNLQYSTLKGTVVIPEKAETLGMGNKELNDESTRWEVRIYCDNKLTQTISAIPTWPYDFEINTKGVNNITFELSYITGEYHPGIHVALTDLALYK